MTYTTTIKPAYISLRSVYLGADAVRDNKLVAGERITVLVEGSPEISAQGTLSTGHGLSGMAKLYAALKLQAGHDLTFKVSQPGGPVVVVPNAAEPAPTVPTGAPNARYLNAKSSSTCTSSHFGLRTSTTGNQRTKRIYISRSVSCRSTRVLLCDLESAAGPLGREVHGEA